MWTNRRLIGRHGEIDTMRWPGRLVAMGLAVLLLAGPWAVGPSAGAETRPQRKGATSKARRKSGRDVPVQLAKDVPPACPREGRVAAAPPPRSMGEMMDRMMDRFMSNPATGFMGVLDDLAQLEGPALEGVSLSPDEERRAGAQARSEYLARARAEGHRVVDDRKRLAYLQELVDRTARRMRHRERYTRIDLTLIDAPVADGQSFPGGSLAFTTALLEEPDEATVAGVVAHELAHLDLGHMYDVARRDKLAREAFRRPFGAGGDFDSMFTRQAALLGMMMRPFRPEQENEADCLAATWMFQEGYDPQALIGFFERLHRRRNDAPEAPVPFLNFLRSHPYSLDRRDHVRARLRQLERWRPRQELGLFAENLRTLRPKVEAAAAR